MSGHVPLCRIGLPGQEFGLRRRSARVGPATRGVVEGEAADLETHGWMVVVLAPHGYVIRGFPVQVIGPALSFRSFITRGITAVAKQFRVMHRYYSGREVRIHNIASNGPIVPTERTDIIRSGSWSAEFWVCGTFEVRDEHIVLWRDYFDMATFLASSARGVGRAAVANVRKLMSHSSVR